MWSPAAVAGLLTAAAGLLTAVATLARQIRHERACGRTPPPPPRGGA